MSRRLLTLAVALLAAVVLSASGAAIPDTGAGTSASGTPTLFSVQGGAPQVLAGGAQKSWQVTVSESRAYDAVFKGGMWLPDATGGRVYASFDHIILHDDGDWTWIGKVATAHGMQSAVITFGKGTVFGVIPQPSAYPLRLVTQRGRTLLLQTDGGKLGQSPTARALRATQDFKLPPRHKASVQPQASAQPQASGNPVIDVMVAYTPGFVSETGSASAALTRIDNLVDVANQAYSDSQVNQSIRLVHTVEVNYPDDTSNESALDDITGSDGTNPHPIPPSLQGIAALRTEYGADLVSMLRSFDNATDGGCGLGWLVGGGEQQIVPSQDNAFGYSVVSDGSDAGFFCLDSTFAHELGHNMGDAHDRAHADSPGAYSYSYGYLGNGTNGFSTIMAYGSGTQIPLDLFSNPDISLCQNTPCGVPDNSPSSADNVHSMNNTSSLIAQFEPTEVGIPNQRAHNDVNGDHKSDLLFEYSNNSQFAYWILDGAQAVRKWSTTTSPAYRMVASGDFNGDGYLDIAWTSSANDVRVWLGNGTSFSMGHPVGTYAPGWRVVGAGDVDGDGKSDLLLEYGNNQRFGYWILNGAQVVRTWSTSTSSAYQLVASGDFNGDGYLDIAWTSAANDVRLWFGTGTTFSMGHPVGNYAPGWRVVGAGDVDADGKSDLLLEYGDNSQFGYWILNGAQVVRTWSTSTSPAYSFVEAGDFDGDGYLDIAWTSSANDMRLWFGNGTTFDMGHPVGTYSSGWTPVVDFP